MPRAIAVVDPESIVPDHNDLSGLQGGTTNQFYHLTAAQYAALGTSSWVEVTGTSQVMAVNQGYVANNDSQVQFTLPSTAAFGSEISVVTKGNGGWKINQNSGQSIIFGSQSSTAGTGGYVQSTINQGDVIKLLCITANELFIVTSAIGNLDII